MYFLNYRLTFHVLNYIDNEDELKLLLIFPLLFSTSRHKPNLLSFESFSQNIRDISSIPVNSIKTGTIPP